MLYQKGLKKLAEAALKQKVLRQYLNMVLLLAAKK
jgi:hypothetical protein